MIFNGAQDVIRPSIREEEAICVELECIPAVDGVGMWRARGWEAVGSVGGGVICL